MKGHISKALLNELDKDIEYMQYLQAMRPRVDNALRAVMGEEIGFSMVYFCQKGSTEDEVVFELNCEPIKAKRVFETMDVYYLSPLGFRYLTPKREHGKFLYRVSLTGSLFYPEEIGYVCIDIVMQYRSVQPIHPIDYKEYLQSDEWRLKRNKLLNHRGYKCENCSSKKNLQIHHLTYERLGFELDNDLVILCQKCHESVHKS